MWKTIDRISDPEGFVEKHVFTADSAAVHEAHEVRIAKNVQQ